MIYPIESVKRNLVKPPGGHYWELGIETDSEGRWLKLSLVNIASAETVSHRRSNLDVDASGRSWQRMATEYPHIGAGIQGRELVEPLTDWAAAKVRQYAQPGMADVEVIA